MRLLSTLLILTAFGAITSMSSCQKDNELQKFGCDTTNISYANDIEPIIQANCYNCHSNANNPIFTPGVDLEGHSDIQFYALDTTIYGSSSTTLLGNIEHKAGYNPMPKGQPKISDCDINKIRTWISNGAPNN